MTPAWSDEDLVCLARDYRNHPDVYDLIEGVRRVLALHQPGYDTVADAARGRNARCCACGSATSPCATVRALNDPPNGA